MCSLLCCTYGENDGRSADGNITTGINMAKCCPAFLINDDIAAFPTHDPIQFTNEKRVWTLPDNLNENISIDDEPAPFNRHGFRAPAVVRIAH